MVNIIKTFRPVYCLFHKPSQVVRVWCLLISGLFYLTAAINTASAATYYIDPVNGNDTDPGTSAEPWKTATKGFQVSTYGDTVMLRNGNYGDVYNPISFPVYTDSMTEPLPPSTEFITFKADVGCEPVFTRVYLGGTANNYYTPYIFDGITISGSDGIDLKRCVGVRFKNCEIVGPTSFENYGIYLPSGDRSNDIKFENCNIHNYFRCFYTYGNNLVITDCEIYNIGEHHIHIIGENILIENNHIHHTNRPGLGEHPDGIFAVLTNSIIRGNTFHDLSTQGIFLAGTSWSYDVLIENNLIYNNIGSEINFGTGERITIRNNTIVGAGTVQRVAVGSIDIDVYNNIFICGYGVYAGEDYHDYNIYVKYGSTIIGNTEPHSYGYDWLGDWEATHNAIEPELFVDPANYDFRLKEGCRAIDFGDPGHGPTTDILGNPRDAFPDAGCYEYVSGPPDPTPPSVPQNLTATPASESQINLSWDASTDPESGVSYYKIYRAVSQIDTSISTFYSNTGLNGGTPYSYEVSAVNGQGLESGLSNTAQATTLTFSDTTPPSIVSVGASETSIVIIFSESLDTISAEQISNYSINGVSITAASLSTNTVTLTTSAHTEGLTYTLTVVDIQDLAGNPMGQTEIDYQYNQGLVGYWKFDEGNGTTAQDSSGAGNTGTLVNGPTWTTGKIGSALRFDGTNNYVDIGAQDVAYPWAASFWVKREDSSNSNAALLDSSNYSLKLEQFPDTDKVGVTAYGVDDYTFNYEAPINIWAHLVFVGTQTQVVLYVDGTLAETIAASISCPMAQISSVSRAAKGTIDEVHIYNRALTASEILDLYLYNEGTTPDTTAPSIPQSLTAQPISQTQIDLTWQASTDPESGISRYNIYRGGTQIGTSTTTSYSNIGLIAETTYTYEVSAVNGASLESARSNVAQATTLASTSNLPPDISAIPNTLPTKQVGETITTAEIELATDPEGDPLTYTYSGWLTSLPYTTTDNDGGSHTLHVDVSDGTNTTGKDIAITVNRPPILSAIGGQSVDENALLSISVNATDPDGQALAYSVTGLPAGAAFVSQALAWTPSYDQQGDYEVTFIASDGQAQDSEAITITVINVNRAPVFTAIDNKSIWADDPLIFTIDATDLDGDPITYSVGTMPSGATFTGQDFDWTPSQSQGGSYDVTFIASDGQAQDSQMVTITVDVDSLAPTVTNLSPTAGSIQVPLNNLITLNIADAGKGVNAKSVKIKVKVNSNPNNNTVYFGDTDYYTSPYGDCRRLGTKADYGFVYQATNEMFYYDQTVTITVNATDLAGNVMSEQYSFVTEMYSFGQNKQVNSGLGNNDRPVTACDISGNIWTAWHAGSIGNRDIYVSKLAAGQENFGGTVQLTDDTTDQCNPAIALDSNDKLYVVWQDNRQGNWDIYVSTSVDGINWSTETMVHDPNSGNQVNPAIVIDGQNYAHVVWQDDREGNQDIFVATSSDGFVNKTVSQITFDISDQVEPAVAADSGNKIYVVWTDGRNGSNDIYGAASNNPWTNVAIAGNTNNQSTPAIAAESTGSILHLLWVDDTPGDNDIYYASSNNGLPGSPLTGSSIIDDISGADQSEPTIAVTGSTTGNNLKVFACWQDWRNTDTDLYFAELSAGSGTNVFVGDGGSNTYQGEPVIGVDEYSHPYLIWADNRNTNTDIYYTGSTFIEPVALASELVTASALSSTTVGADPQAITSIDDVSIVVPVGACSYDVAITVTKIANPQAFAAPCLGGYDFGPSGIQFSQPVTITIPYVYSGSDSVAPYWFNSLAGMLSQQGITGIQDIPVSSSLHALSFNTTHFTAFYLLGGGGAAAVIAGGGGGGGGGCSVSADGEGNIVEFLLPYIGFVVVLAIMTVRDSRIRKARST